MKKECAVVQDLLVLYEDDVLREQSKEMIEEHIRGCEECMQVYESISRELPAVESVREPSEEEQENEAAQIMKKLTKRITYKTGVVLASVVAVFCIVAGIADTIYNQWAADMGGIQALISAIPTENIQVTEMYQLKNGDIYCTLESKKAFGIQQIEDWVVPTGKECESTKEAVKEFQFKNDPLSLDTVRVKQTSMILALERQGVVDETGETITQNCAEICVYGKTKKDKLTIWKAGQKVEAAPESIEEEAVHAYVQNGQILKAIEECRQMGWDEYEKIFDEMGLAWRSEWGNWDLGVTFTNEGESISLY